MIHLFAGGFACTPRTRHETPGNLVCYLLNRAVTRLAIFETDGDLSAFVRWLTMTYTQRWHAHRRSAGSGPLYQGRFKSFPVDHQDRHLAAVVTCVEQNPRRAGLSRR